MTPINTAFNVAVKQMANRLFPTGFNVSADAPRDIESLCKSFKSGRATVWGGASQHTIFACKETNLAFRAWHDHCHIRPCFQYGWDFRFAFPFTREGEQLTLNEQCRDIVKVYGHGHTAKQFIELLHAEVIGQFDYAGNHDGMFPLYQARFVRAYLVNPESAVKSDFGISIEV